MAAHHPHHHPELHPNERVHHEVTPTAKTLTTFVVLAALTGVALAVGFAPNLGPLKVLASLAVAVVEAGVLAYFFMDLKYADKLTWLTAVTSLFFVAIMFLFTLTDYFTRHLGAL